MRRLGDDHLAPTALVYTERVPLADGMGVRRLAGVHWLCCEPDSHSPV